MLSRFELLVLVDARRPVANFGYEGGPSQLVALEVRGRGGWRLWAGAEAACGLWLWLWLALWLSAGLVWVRVCVWGWGWGRCSCGDLGSFRARRSWGWQSFISMLRGRGWGLY